MYREWQSEDRTHPKNRSKTNQLDRRAKITDSLAKGTSEKKEIILLGDLNTKLTYNNTSSLRTPGQHKLAGSFLLAIIITVFTNNT